MERDPRPTNELAVSANHSSWALSKSRLACSPDSSSHGRRIDGDVGERHRSEVRDRATTVPDLHAPQLIVVEIDHFVSDGPCRDEREHALLRGVECDGGEVVLPARPGERLRRGVASGACEHPGGYLPLDEGCGPEVPTVLLCHEREVEQRSTPAPRGLVDRHVQGAHVP